MGFEFGSWLGYRKIEIIRRNFPFSTNNSWVAITSIALSTLQPEMKSRNGLNSPISHFPLIQICQILFEHFLSHFLHRRKTLLLVFVWYCKHFSLSLILAWSRSLLFRIPRLFVYWLTTYLHKKQNPTSETSNNNNNNKTHCRRQFNAQFGECFPKCILKDD